MEKQLAIPTSVSRPKQGRRLSGLAASFLVLQLCAAGVMVGGVAMAPTAVEAAQVRTRGGSHADYGRLVFDWPKPVEYQARIEGDRLIITFSDSIETDLSSAVRRISKYVAGGQLSMDGRTLSFRLSGDYELATASDNNGRKIIVDLKKTGTRQAIPVETGGMAVNPSQAQGQPRSGVKVPVRVGQHPDYSRIVFDWPQATTYSITRSGSQATLKFTSPGQIETAAIANMLPRGFGALKMIPGRQDSTVIMTVPPTAKLRHFKSGNRVIVDVLGRVTAPRHQSPAAQPQAMAGAVTVPPASSASGSQPMPAASKPASVQALTDQYDLGILPPQVASNRPNPNDPIRVQYVEGKDGATLAFAWPYPVPMAAFVRGDHLWVVFNERKEFNFEEIDMVGQDFITRHEVLTPEGARGAVLRFLLPPNQKVTTERQSTSWIVRVGPEGATLDDTVDAEMREDSEKRPEVFLATGAVSEAVRIEDPNFNDTLFIFPVQKARFGKEKLDAHDDFELLPTAQGFVMVQRNSSIMAMASETGLTIKTPTGLSTPSLRDPGLLDKGADGGEEADLPRLFPLENWRRGVPQQYFSIHQELSDALGDSLRRVESTRGRTQQAAIDELNRRRANLAHFYFASGLMRETITMIETILDKNQNGDPGYLNDRVFVAMRGVTRLELGDVKGAEEDLMIAALDGEKEADLWRAMLLHKMGNLTEASVLLEGTNPWYDAYPTPWRWDMRLRSTEAAVSAGDQNQIQEYLDALGGDDPDIEYRDRGQYWHSRSLALAGNEHEAINTLSELRTSPDRWTATRARFDHALMKVNRGPLSALTPETQQATGIVSGETDPDLAEEQKDPEMLRQDLLEEAIQDFERLRWGWRGDDFELDVLRQLGEFYLQSGSYRKALTTWRRVPNYFPTAPKAKEVTARMMEVFADLYLRDKADELPPVTALALFDEFRELVPVGEDGDEMIRKLADRLVAVNLFERAASLLEHQVKFRLDGEAKSRVGARLATIRLLDDKAAEAEAGLDASEIAGVPEDLAAHRARLRAKAVYDLGRAREAVAFIDEDLSLDAEKLRAEFAWGQQRWLEAAIALERLLGSGPAKGTPVSPEQSALILDLAIALTMAGEYEQLDSLYRRYAIQLQGTKTGQSLTMLATAPVDSTQVRTIALELSEVKTFQDFLSTLR